MSASRDHFRKYPVKFVSFKDFRFQDIKDFSNDLRDFKLVADPSESIAENQPLEIPSFCTRDRDLPIPMFPYITAFYSLSPVLLSTLLKLKVKSTIDACVDYAMQE